MDRELWEKGLKARKATLGAEYVEMSLSTADEFNADFQDMLNEFCWGKVWGDDTIPANTGKWTLTIESGRAHIAKGGRGDIRLDARTLAPLFSGYLSLGQLAQLGKVEGDPATISAAASAFPTGTPWLSDMY